MSNKEYTMKYHKLTTDEQYDRFIELSKMGVKDFPQDLKDKLQEASKVVGMCGEIIFDTIANYVKYGDGITAGDLYGPAMKVKTHEEAREQLERIIDYLQYRNISRNKDHARSIALQNLGYWAGYYDKDTRDHVNKLYDTRHPIYGKDY